MHNFINYLRKHLTLNGFIFVQTSHNTFIIFKSYSKYSKCIYLNFSSDRLDIHVDKVFDTKGYYDNIERIFIDSNCFYNYYESFDYIQKNVAI